MRENNTIPVAVIGAGKMAYDCIARILERRQLDLRLLLTPPGDDHADRRLARLSASHGIRHCRAHDPNEQAVVAEFRVQHPALVFNINGLSILRSELLSTASGGFVSFHNGPLPAYAGLNIPTWAIWNGEVEHGVSWHFVSAVIDGGNILTQTYFPVGAEETASELMFRCIIAGTRLFERTLDLVIAGERAGTPQEGQRSYYRANHIPNDGVIDLRWPAQTMNRFLRAFDYWPFPSPVGYPRLETGVGWLPVVRAVVEPDHQHGATAAGTVITSGDALAFGLPDGVLVIRSVADAEGRPMTLQDVTVTHRLRPGLVVAE